MDLSIQMSLQEAKSTDTEFSHNKMKFCVMTDKTKQAKLEIIILRKSADTLCKNYQQVYVVNVSAHMHTQNEYCLSLIHI